MSSRRTRPIALALVAAACAAPAAAQGTAAPAPSASAAEELLADTKLLAHGREIYHGQGTCYVCHGEHLEGQVGPTLRAHDWKHAKNGDFGEIQRVVMSGAPGTAMVAQPGGISAADAHAVALYVWAVAHNRAKP